MTVKDKKLEWKMIREESYDLFIKYLTIPSIVLIWTFRKLDAIFVIINYSVLLVLSSSAHD